jgi:cytochrome c biogenesis protein CcmG/thiol:disulfide interchange protein DsbE
VLGACLLAVVVLVVLLTGGDDGATTGGPAPAVDLPDVRAGRPRVVLASLRGTPVIVNFWATWCVPCRQELPLLADASERLGGRVAVVGVDVRDNRDAARRFLAARGADYPSAYDPEATTRRGFGYAGLPVTVLVDRDGTLLDRVTGRLTKARLDGLLERAQATE